jgi:hypothetical protein
MKRLILIVVLMALALAGFAQTPARVRVAILPVLNQSGEKWEELKRKQVEKAEEFLYDEFGKRSFEIVSKDEVERSIADLQIDLTDEEQQKRATLYSLGERLNADYVIFGVITHTEQKEFERVLYKDIEGRTDVKIWLVDVRAKQPVISAKTFTGRSGGNRITLKPSDRQIQASANAFRDALKEFFRAFPVQKR